jgi:hypothetical protein
MYIRKERRRSKISENARSQARHLREQCKKKGKYQEKQVCSFGWWLMAGADLF